MFSKKPDKTPDNQADQPPVDLVNVVSPGMSGSPSPLKKAEPQRGFGNSMVPSIIGEDLSVTGNIVSKGEVQIEGEIQGDIHCSSLVIGDKAQVTGGVVADDVVVRGRIAGSIRGLRVTLQASSHVEGDIYHQSLAIEQGAFFEGKSRRADDPTAVSADAGSSKSPAANGSSGAGNSGSGSSGSGSGDKSGKDDTVKAPRAAE